MISKKGFGKYSHNSHDYLKNVMILIQSGKILEAEEILLSLKTKKGLNHIGFHLLSIIYRTKSDYSLALEYLNQSIKKDPFYADAYSDIGALYIEMNNIPLAIKYLQKSLEINPNKLSPNKNLGILFRKLGKLQLALKFFFKALDLDLNNSGLHFSIGQIYDQLDNFEKAILHYKKSVLLDDKNGNALISLYAMYLKTFDWNSINNISSKLDDFGTEFFQGGQPLTLLFHNDDPYKQKLMAENFFNNVFKRKVLNHKFTKNKKIRIGYISNNFVMHPVSFLIEKVIEIHNRTEFEIYGYSINSKEDNVTKKFYKSFDVFRNISKISDEKANKIIREDKIDILIDLMGYTPGSRMGILSTRAAPIQINYLAYPATTGSDQIDYIISDENVIPIDKQDNFSEKVIYLPRTFICFNDSTQISSNLREDPFQNLDPNFSILLAFHRVEKMSTKALDCWIKVMHKYIDSYLWVKETNKLATNNLLDYFKSKSIDLSRIIFAKRENLYEDHLARYKKGDLLLDTFLYNGHTTTIEALWSGLPVITLEGNSFASRVSASILKSIGLDELISFSKEEYTEKIIFYLSNKSELYKLKSKLKNLKKDGKLFNTKEFVSNFETILKKLNTQANY